MKILVTGAKGFVGKNLVAFLENIKMGNDCIHQIYGLLQPDGSYQPEKLDIVSYDKDSDSEYLEKACRDCDFVFNLAGVNRPKEQHEFMSGNFDFISELLGYLKKYNNTCPIMLSSSIQATLTDRYIESAYGESKLAAERLLQQYAEETGAKILIYRFPNLFGKWCRPNYNSVIATFCHSIANDLEINVSDRSTSLEFLYIDDLLEEMLMAVNGEESRCEFNGLTILPQENGRYCYVPTVYTATLGEIADLLEEYKDCDMTLSVPVIPENTFAKKLYSTYLSYLPTSKIKLPTNMNVDARGSFTELVHTLNCGQVSVNIANPGISRGNHWHHSKWEWFIVVSGEGLIRQRRIGTEDIIESRVSGRKVEVVRILPGYTHCIINLSDSDKLITIMWANEPFDSNRPDTFAEKV